MWKEIVPTRREHWSAQAKKSGSLGRHDFMGYTFYSPLHPTAVKLILISAVLWLKS
jgi:hypothetical protein